jgi:type IV pilus assembly protein PilE
MTLIEVVLVVGLLGLLLSLAMPSYQSYLLRGHRVEAIRLLLTAAACQERHRARTGAYDTTRCAGSSGNEFYRLIIEPEGQPSSSEFILLAEPLARQQGDICGSLSLDQSGTQGIGGPEDKLQKCWAGR